MEDQARGRLVAGGRYAQRGHRQPPVLAFQLLPTARCAPGLGRALAALPPGRPVEQGGLDHQLRCYLGHAVATLALQRQRLLLVLITIARLASGRRTDLCFHMDSSGFGLGSTVRQIGATSQ